MGTRSSIISKILNKKKHKSNKSDSLLNRRDRFYHLNKNTRKNKSNRRRISKLSKNLLILLLTLLSLILLIVLIYYLSLFVLKIREDVNEKEKIYATVIGFDELPAYPDSEYIFISTSSSEYSKELINNGYSVYRIPEDTSFNDIIEFYNKELAEKGFEKVNSFPIRTDNNIEGEYWIKEDKGYHIYSRINDIWYERISVNEAKDGLAKNAKEIASRNLLLFTSGNQSLLPNYPWRSSIPSNAIITYSNTQFGDLQNVKIELNEFNIITKIDVTGIYAGGVLDNYLDKFALENNITVISKSYDFVFESGAINFSGSINSTSTTGFLFIHPQSGYVYVMYNIGEKNDMYNYIKSNLQPALK